MAQRIRYLSHGHAQANMKIQEHEATIRDLRTQLRQRQARPLHDQTKVRELEAKIRTLEEDRRKLKEKAELQAGRAIKGRLYQNFFSKKILGNGKYLPKNVF